MNDKQLQLLIRSFDAKLSKEEQDLLHQALKSSPELRSEQKRIIDMRKRLTDSGAYQFKPFFSARVMQKIKSSQSPEEEFANSLSWAFRMFATAGAVAIILLFSINSKLGKETSLNSIFNIPTITLENTWQLDNPLEEKP